VKNHSVCVLLFAAVCTLSYAQDGQGDDHGQGDQQGHPAVPKQQGAIRPHVWIHGSVGPNANPAATTLMTPALMTAAYGINGVGSGQGATVAIVDAYDAPNVAADLASFMSQWGISCPTPGWGTFTKVNQNGRTSPLPSYDSGWEVETSMDTQWVRAIAPCANLVLVEANSSLDSDLMAAVSTAATLGSVVSMSWGGSESGSQTSYDSFFVRNGVTFLASSGDTGGVVEWPSSSPNVIAVGGTNLNYSNGTLASETAWSGSGGGCSSVEPAMAAQTGLVPSSCKNRATPDVSIDGGGLSPVYVLISKQGGWYSVYGTSLSVQLWAGVTALANALHGASLNGVQSALYADAAGAPSSAPYTSNYRDITSGSAGSFSAGPGWDFVTGLGSPLVNTLVLSLVGPPTSNFTLSDAPSSQTVAQGNPASYTATVTPSNGFTGSVALSASGLPTGATATFGTNPIAGGSGSSAMSVTTSSTTPTGTYTLTITGTSGSLVHSTTVSLTVNPAPVPDFSLSRSPSSLTLTQGGSI
jgi:subtilase family serine protease